MVSPLATSAEVLLYQVYTLPAYRKKSLRWGTALIQLVQHLVGSSGQTLRLFPVDTAREKFWIRLGFWKPERGSGTVLLWPRPEQSTSHVPTGTAASAASVAPSRTVPRGSFSSALEQRRRAWLTDFRSPPPLPSGRDQPPTPPTRPREGDIFLKVSWPYVDRLASGDKLHEMRSKRKDLAPWTWVWFAGTQSTQSAGNLSAHDGADKLNAIVGGAWFWRNEGPILSPRKRKPGAQLSFEEEVAEMQWAQCQHTVDCSLHDFVHHLGMPDGYMKAVWAYEFGQALRLDAPMYLKLKAMTWGKIPPLDV